jgi:uncharacterized membrane protein YphA (DoxX/SURF4 family)
MRMFRRQSDELVIMVLRFSIGSVFLWFGIDKWIHPEAWFAWVPTWFWPFIGDGKLFMVANGVFEFALGVLFVAGRLLRPASALAGAFLIGVMLAVGANEVTVRDTALFGSCLALFVHANAKARKPVSETAIARASALFVAFLLVYGILYLRGGAS